MKAVGLDYGQRRLCAREMAEPEPRDDEALLEIVEVGVCGTDRELAQFHYGEPPAGEDFLVLGHEALARVVAVGSKVEALRPGDWVSPLIRRSCHPPCQSCRRNRRDLCTSGKIRERGIFRAHGYFARYAVDAPVDLVTVPADLADRAILLEPLSVVEKAVEIALRYHEPGARTCLVIGAGPIGILCALVLQRRGLDVTIASLEDESAPRVKLIRRASIGYRRGLDGAERADIVMEASGSADAVMKALRLLAPLGVYGLIGACQPSGELPLIDMIINNQVLFGTVNASPAAYRQGVEDLAQFDSFVVEGLIERTGREDFERTILGSPGPSVKLVHRLVD